MTDLVIYSVGPFARLMRYYFDNDSEHRVVGFTADADYLDADEFCGLPAVPFDCVAETWSPERAQMFVAIGYRRMRNRARLFQRAKTAGYRLANYVSSRAIVYPDLQIGENNVVMAGVHVEPFVSVCDNNVFWSETLVCHGVRIGSGNSFGARCLRGGESTIAGGCFLGNGATLIDHVALAPETYILPGAVVLQNTREFRRYMGNPAREAGCHEEEGIVIERG